MNILIVSSAKFPEGDAESVRLHTMGKMFREVGHNVSFVGMGYDEYLKLNEFDGFKHTTLRKAYRNKYERIYFYLNYKYRLKKFINSKIQEEKIDCILFADLEPNVISMIKNICYRNNIKIIVDSVEWYSHEQFKLGSLSPAMILKNIENKYTIDKNVKVIAISRYLEEYFNNKGCDVIRVPAILDVKKIGCEKKCRDDQLTILYAGSPGKKDYVEEMLRGILLLNYDERRKLKFILAGVSDSDIQLMFSREHMSSIKECVKCLGRINRQNVLSLLSQVDFTVLLRSSEQRYAKAGFPTKVVESLATGTPVILNLTSDLGEYILNNEEGLIVEECTSVEFANTLRYAIGLDNSQIKVMKKKARICAEKNFDYRNYVKNVGEFIKG